MKKQLLNLCAAVALFFLGQSVMAQYVAPITTLDVSAKKGSIKIDAQADEDSWPADWQTTKIGKKNDAGCAYADGTDDFDLKFKLCWDTSYLYMVASVKDEDPDNFIIGAGSAWTWDNVEAFIDLDTNSATSAYGATRVSQIRFSRGLLSAADDDSLVQSNGRDAAKVADFKFYVDNEANIDNGSGWCFEVAIPWAAVTTEATVDIDTLTVEGGGTVIGFDVAGADSDGAEDGDADGGNRATDGQQSFWDLDDPAGTGAEDAAYENQLLFGFIRLVGTPVSAVNETSVSASTVAYPNPTTGILNFNSEVTSVQIMNIAGQVVLSRDVNGTGVDLSPLQAGVYFANIDGKITKVIKK